MDDTVNMEESLHVSDEKEIQEYQDSTTAVSQNMLTTSKSLFFNPTLI